MGLAIRTEYFYCMAAKIDSVSIHLSYSYIREIASQSFSGCFHSSPFLGRRRSRWEHWTHMAQLIVSATNSRTNCDCPLEIRVLPYIDERCSVGESPWHSLNFLVRFSAQSLPIVLFQVFCSSEMDLIHKEHPNTRVFHANVGRYQLNFYEAERLCEILGGRLATYDQLHRAWENGYERCE